MEEYIKDLNKQQQDAVLYTDGPSLGIAGAGSGKTRVLTYKIVHLLNHGFEPWRILALTFTNKAAREMRELGEKGKILTGCEEHIALSRAVAAEGMVLLKNENHTLPLAAGTRVALFGKGTIDYVKGGGGSGDVTVPYVRNLYEGFCVATDASCVFPDTISFYREQVEKQFSMERIYRLLFGAGQNFEVYDGQEIQYYVPRDPRTCVDWYMTSMILYDEAEKQKA